MLSLHVLLMQAMLTVKSVKIGRVSSSARSRSDMLNQSISTPWVAVTYMFEYT